LFSAFLPRKPKFLGVEKAWISLDSLVRNETYQLVMRFFPEIFFLSPSVVAREPAGRPNDFALRKRQTCSSNKPNQISDFLQDIAVRVVSLAESTSLYAGIRTGNSLMP
jgi:hypothetical protein